MSKKLTATQLEVLRRLRKGDELVYHPSHGGFDPGGYHWGGVGPGPSRPTMDALRSRGLVGFRKLDPEMSGIFAPSRHVVLTRAGAEAIDAARAKEKL